jgi:hypothetical protein
MLYIGIADVQVPDQAVDLDGGVTLSPARSRLMRPFLLTSGWGEPETSFGGNRIHSKNSGYDIVGQVAVPTALVSDSGLHVDGTAWLFASLLRLASTPRLRAPVVSTGAFDGQMPSAGVQTVPLEREIIPDRLDLAPDAPASLSPANLDWVRAHWSKCLDLVRRDSAFGLLLRAVDGAAFVGDASLALVMMWGALENIFSPARVELKFRVSGNISCFLEPPGASRVTVQRASAKLYDARSAAAHGKPHDALAPAAQTYGLACRVITKILETGKVPNASDLEEMLLAGR